MAKATCKEPTCENPVECRGWCHRHYVRWSKYGDPLFTKINRCTVEHDGTCIDPTCERPVASHGRCKMHDKRWRTNGTMEPRYVPTTEEHFWAKVDKNGPLPERRPDLGPCWLWKASILPVTGYGSFNSRTDDTAHRYAYKLLVGPIPPGLELDHLCRNRWCSNPAHLEPVTSTENNLRGESLPARNARKMECDNGHSFTEGNTYYDPRGWRQCRACGRTRQSEYEHRKMATMVR